MELSPRDAPSLFRLQAAETFSQKMKFHAEVCRIVNAIFENDILL